MSAALKILAGILFIPVFIIVLAIAKMAIVENFMKSENISNTREDVVTYSPDTCKTDAQGMVYFALGREVFRKPHEESTFIFFLYQPRTWQYHHPDRTQMNQKDVRIIP